MNRKLLPAVVAGAACLGVAAAPGLAQVPPSPAEASPVPAAAAPETPGWAWGTWATPSCEAPEVVSFGTDQLVIARNREGQVWAFAKEAFVQAGADWVRVRYGSGLSGQVQLARPEGEDRLQIADFLGPAPPPSDSDLAAGAVAPSSPAWRLTEWQRCDSVPGEAALVHAEPAAVLASLRDVQDACAGGGDEEACGAAVLRAVDVSGDGLVATAEVARVLRVVGYMAGVAPGLERGQPTTEKELSAWLAGGLFLGPALAELLVKSLGYDADGRLSPAELAQDRAGALGGLAGRLDVGTGQAQLGRAFGQLRDLAVQLVTTPPSPRPR